MSATSLNRVTLEREAVPLTSAPTVERGIRAPLALNKTNGQVAFASSSDAFVADINHLEQGIKVFNYNDTVKSLEFSSSGDYLGVGTKKSAYIYSLKDSSYQLIHDSPESAEGVMQIRFTSDDKYFISASKNSEDAMRCRKLSDGKDLKGGDVKFGGYKGCFISEHGEVIGYNESRNVISFKYSPLKWVHSKTFENLAHCGTFIKRGGDSSKFLLGCGFESFALYDFNTLDVECLFKDKKQSSTFDMQLNPNNDGQIMSLHGAELCFRIWDIEKKSVLALHPILDKQNKNKMPHAGVWYNNEILIATLDGTLMKYDVRSGESVSEFNITLSSTYNSTRQNIIVVEPDHEKRSLKIADTNLNISYVELDDDANIKKHTSYLQEDTMKPDYCSKMAFTADTAGLGCIKSDISHISFSNNSLEKQALAQLKCSVLVKFDEKNLILSSYSDQFIYLFEVASKSLTKLVNLKFDAKHMSLSPNKKMVVCYDPENLKVLSLDLDTKTATAIYEHEKTQKQKNASCFSPDSKILAIAYSSSVYFYDAENNFTETLKPISSDMNLPRVVSWNPESPYLIGLGDISGTIKVANPYSESPRTSVVINHSHGKETLTNMKWVAPNILVSSTKVAVKLWKFKFE